MIPHLFLNANWPGGFSTAHGILHLPRGVAPQVLFLGTWNPDRSANPHFNGVQADFFYGRNHFWRAFDEFLDPGRIPPRPAGPRFPPNGNPVPPYDPTLDRILEITGQLHMSFADLVAGLFPNNDEAYDWVDDRRVSWNGQVVNVIRDQAQNGDLGIDALDQEGQILWNTEHIITYLCDNPQIKHIYFTRQRNGIWEREIALIEQSDCMNGRTVTPIFTPAGMGVPAGYRLRAYIKHHWLHNVDPNYGTLDHEWLRDHGIDPDPDQFHLP